MELEGVEQQIFLQPEMAIVGAVYSVNGYTGHVVLTTSDLENTSGYQTSTDVATLISAHNTSEEAHPYIQALISAKQDPIVAGNGINVSDENVVSVDTTVVATQQNLATEVTNRENADIALQGQIDAISASSDVVDIVGTYAELQSYDTSKLKDNDIIKVLQDSTQGNATTYYRWSTTTQTFTLIGQEGPYYTKAAADAQFVPQTRTINSKPLSANITLTASDVSALGQSDIVQTTGTSTTKVMSQNAVTTALATKLDSADVPAGFFDGEATVTPTAGTSLEIDGAIKVKSVELQGDTQQQTYTGKNLIHFNPETRSNGGIDYTITNDTIVGAGVTTGTNSVASSNYYFPTLLSAGTYTFSIPQALSVQIFLSVIDDNSGFHNFIILPGDTSVTVTTDYTMERYRLAFTGWTAGDSVSISLPNKLQLEAGSTATPYEKFVGGTASPNPDYPQTVEVVTGEQTISVSDGTNSTDYTVDLGSIELCKIGNYQDYIYKSGDDWYVHKATGKVVLDGSETWSRAGLTTGVRYFSVRNDINLRSVDSDGSDIMSDKFIGVNYITYYSIGGITGISHNTYQSNNYIQLFFATDSFGDTTALKTWLSTNNTTVYYALATATDTKITDSTLTRQLDALLSAQMYPEYTAISSNGNLPAILGITAYNSNLNGIIEVLASTASALGNVNSALNVINNGGN